MNNILMAQFLEPLDIQLSGLPEKNLSHDQISMWETACADIFTW